MLFGAIAVFVMKRRKERADGKDSGMANRLEEGKTEAGKSLVAVELTDSVLDVTLFVTSFNTGALAFQNDPSNIVLILLAGMGGLSVIACVTLMLLFYAHGKAEDPSNTAFTRMAPYIFIASILFEDLFQLTIYLILTLSNPQVNVAVLAAVVKSLLMFVYKTADFLGLKSLRDCGEYFRRVPGLRSSDDAADSQVSPRAIAPQDSTTGAGKASSADSLERLGRDVSSSAQAQQLQADNVELPLLKAQVDAMAHKMQGMTSDIEEMRVEIRELKAGAASGSTEPVARTKPWRSKHNTKSKAAAGPKSPADQVAV